MRTIDRRTVLSSAISFSLLARTPAIAQQAQPKKIRVGILPIYDTLPLYVGRDQGVFRDEGIDIELVTSPGGPVAISAMEGGSLDLAYTGVSSIFQAVERGLKVKIVAPAGTVSLSQHNDGARLLAAKDSQIKSLTDVKGKRVATNQLQNQVHLYILAAFDDLGLKPGSYTITEVPYPQMPDALLNRQVDLIYEVDPFITILIEGGKVVDFGSATFKIHPNMRFAAYIATQRWLDANPELARRFLRAYGKAATYVMQNKNMHGEWQVKYFRVPSELKDKVASALFQDQDLGPDFVGSLTKTKDLMLKYKFLRSDFSVDSCIFR